MAYLAELVQRVRHVWQSWLLRWGLLAFYVAVIAPIALLRRRARGLMRGSGAAVGSNWHPYPDDEELPEGGPAR